MAALAFGRNSPGGRLRNRALTVLFASMIFLLSVLAHAPSARADSTLVQQNNGGCATTSCSPSAISFPSSVTAGDVVVVMITVVGGYGSGSVDSVSDTLGTSFTLVVVGSISTSYNSVNVYVYDATLSSSGSDSIFVSFAGVIEGGVYVYEVSGVTTAGAVYEGAGGECDPPPCSISTYSTAASFQSGAFLVSMVGYPNPRFSGCGRRLYPVSGVKRWHGRG